MKKVGASVAIAAIALTITACGETTGSRTLSGGGMGAAGGAILGAIGGNAGLGAAVGNSLEVLECLEILRGERHPMSADLRTLSVELSAWMFLLGGRVASVAEGRQLSLLPKCELPHKSTCSSKPTSSYYVQTK